VCDVARRVCDRRLIQDKTHYLCLPVCLSLSPLRARALSLAPPPPLFLSPSISLTYAGCFAPYTCTAPPTLFSFSGAGGRADGAHGGHAGRLIEEKTRFDP